MKFKIKKVLTPRQLLKAKFSIFMASCLCIFTLGSMYLDKAEAADDKGPYMYDGAEFTLKEEATFKRGRIVYYSNNEEVCNR